MGIENMPKRNKRWTSYELMLKRVKKRPYKIAECWFYDPMRLWLPRQDWMENWIPEAVMCMIVCEAYF